MLITRVLHSLKVWWALIKYLRKDYYYYYYYYYYNSEPGYYRSVLSGLRTAAHEFRIQAGVRSFFFLQNVLWTPQAPNQWLHIFLFQGVKWQLREYSSNIICRRATIHAKKARRGSGGKFPLYPYFIWWTAEPFKMFRTSEKYLASTGIRNPKLSDRILPLYRLSYRGLPTSKIEPSI